MVYSPKFQRGVVAGAKERPSVLPLMSRSDRKWASAGVVMNDLAMEKTMNFSFVSCLLLLLHRRVVFACVVVGASDKSLPMRRDLLVSFKGVKSSALKLNKNVL